MDQGKTTFLRDMTKESWVLVEDVENPQLLIATDFDPVTFLEDEDGRISIEELCRRAKAMQCNFGQKTAEHILMHNDRIPEDFIKYNILFPGTAWRHPRGHILIPYLYCQYTKWKMHFLGWTGDIWIPNPRLLRLRK